MSRTCSECMLAGLFRYPGRDVYECENECVSDYQEEVEPDDACTAFVGGGPGRVTDLRKDVTA